jgi:signal transduction histidine kinase
VIRSVAFALITVAVTAAVAGIVYGTDAAGSVAEVLAPLSVGTALAAHAVAAGRARLGGLRRQLALVGVVAVVQLAIAVALFVDLMFVSGHDAFFTALVAGYTGVIGLYAGRLTSRSALADVERIRTALRRVADGERDVRTGVVGRDELGTLGTDVDAMVAKLTAEERARRRLIAAVSHDLRTPITSLQLLAEAIDDDIIDAPTRHDYLGRMTTHVRQSSALIDDLFELSRLEAGDIRWSVEHVRLHELLEETLDAMRTHAEAGGVAVRTEVVDGIAARANPEQLQRVLVNLIQNAIRHTPADGSVTVRAEPGAGGIEIEVTDTGAGIAHADRARVFEPFVQGLDRAARTDGGAGLGLAISRAIVEAHGGRIWLADTTLGTSVRFSLPAATATA